MSPFSKKQHFFKELVWGLSYYENTYLRLISSSLLLCSIALIYFSPETWAKIIFSIFTFLLLFKEFYQCLELRRKEDKIDELEKKKIKEIEKSGNALRKNILHSLLEFLGKFFDWKGGFRFTIFTLSQENGVECIKSVYRTSFGSPPGISTDHKAYFTKGRGLPGKAWGDAWDKENLEDLIDRIKLGNVPGNILADNSELKEYYKKTFCTTEEIFNSLEEDKNQIRSYLSIGIVGHRNELSYVLSIDSTEEGAFDDFQTTKYIKEGKFAEVTTVQGAIETTEETEETDHKEPGTLTTESEQEIGDVFPKVEIPKEFLEIIPQEGQKLFKELEKGKSAQISGMFFAALKQTGIIKPKVDRFVHTFGMILKLIETIMKERISFK